MLASDSDNTAPKQPKATRKRKRAQTVDQPFSPSSEYRFQAKQARLDKITDTLIGKAFPSSAVTQPAATLSPSKSGTPSMLAKSIRTKSKTIAVR